MASTSPLAASPFAPGISCCRPTASLPPTCTRGWRPRVKVLTLSWVSFATGYTVDLERIGRACRERDVYFVVDAIQGVGARTLDAHACGIDILACGGQKWLLSPWGTGFAYVRSELVRELEPREIGWLAVRDSYDFTRLV